MSWAFGELAPFDLETTGVDVETARIVTAAVGHIVPGNDPVMASHLVAVDVEISAEAAEVHGITTEYAREHGRPVVEVLEAVADTLAKRSEAGAPIVGMNLPFDLTILDRELRRNDLAPLEDRLGRPIGPVIDVFVIDKAVDRFRRGGRKLADLCAHYGVRIGDAHDAAADALAAARVAYAMCRRGVMDPAELEWRYADRPRQAPHIVEAFGQLGSLSLAELHEAQRGWYREQAKSLAQYFRQKANDEEHRAESLDDGEREVVLADVERLRDRADGVLTEWPMAMVRP